MKNLFALGLVISLPLVSTSVSAQKKALFTSNEVEIVAGPESAMDKKSELMGFVAEENGEFIHYSEMKDRHRFERFNADFKSVAAHEIPFSEEKGVDEHSNLPELFNGMLLHVTEEKNSKAKTSTCWLTFLDPKTFKATGERKKLFQFSGGRYYKRSTLPDVHTSPDKSKILVAMPLWEEEYKAAGWLFSVYDSNMKLIWEKEQVNNLQSGFTETSFFNISVNNDGSVRFLAREKKWKDDYKSQEWLWVSVNNKDVKTVHTSIPVAEGSVQKKPWYRTLSNGDAVIVGYYSNKDNEQSKSRAEKVQIWDKMINGTYIYAFDMETGKLKNTINYEFPIDVAMRYRDSGHKERAEKDASEGMDVGIRELKLAEVKVLPSGGFVISGESKFSKASVLSTDDKSFYYNRNIYVTYVNPLMEVEWSTVVPKYQVSTDNERGHGFLMVAKGNKLFFLYNDSPKNLAKDWNGGMVHSYMGNNAPVTLATIDISDPEKMTRQQVWTQEEVGGGLFMFGSFMFPMPVTYETIFDHGVLLYRLANNKAQQRYLRMTVK